MKNLICILCIMLTLISTPMNSISISAKITENPYSQFIDDPYYENSFDAINGIKDRLSNLPASKIVSIDFLSQEILLHRMSLLISTIIQSYSSNPELIEIAEDILDDYPGEIREMREVLNKLINSSEVKEASTNDTEYMKEYKNVITQVNKELSSINADSTVEGIYIKQTLAILQAANTLAKNAIKYEKNTITKKISDEIIQNTSRDIERLKTLLTAFE